MFRIKFLLIFLLFLSGRLLADKSTKNNYTGSWTDNNSWTGGTAPNTTSLPSPVDENYTINGYITVGSFGANQNLTFAANKDSYTITINDTLIVYGDVDFANKAMDLVISDGGFLIILGDLQMNNKIDIAANGHIIVSGNFDKTGSQGSFTGTGNVYAGSYSGDASALVPDGQEKDTGTDLSTDFPDIADFVGQGGQSALPVTVVYLKALAQDNMRVTIEWATSYEINFDYFTIERSENGLVFKEIGEVRSSNIREGNIRKYSFYDEMPVKGLAYYRLKATDLDGSFEYHGVVAARFYGFTDPFSVYPNPSDGIHINFKNGYGHETHVRIVNFSGQEVFRGDLPSGNHELALADQLPEGVYFIFAGPSGKAPFRLVVR